MDVLAFGFSRIRTILGTYTVTAGTPVSIPVTSQVQAAMSTGKKLSIVVFGSDANNGQNNVSNAASESNNSTQRPILHIQ